MKYTKWGLFLFLIFSLAGCNEDASVSELSSESGFQPTVDSSPPLEEIAEEPAPEPEPIEAIDTFVETSDEEESSDEVLSEEETNQDPIQDDVVEESDDVDPVGDESGDDVAEETEEDVAQEEEEQEEDIVDTETEEDEENDEVCRTEGNIILNGSFEASDDRKGLRGKKLSSLNHKSWDVFQSLPGGKDGADAWQTSSGPGIEVQGDLTVTKAPHGKRVVELDSHGAQDTNSSMSQDVVLCRGKHVLKFMYYPRTSSKGDNTIEVRIGDKVVKSVDMVKNGKWIRIRVPFRVKEKKSYKVTFAAMGKDNSLGGLIDKISLHKRKRRAGVVTSLLSLGDKDNIPSPLIRREVASAIIRKIVNFASLKKSPKVLMVKDSAHGGESLDDFVLTESVLKELFGNDKVSVWSEDLRMQNARDFDVIYVINPGHPLGSSITAATLNELKDSGKVGIVLHGDDLARGRNVNLSSLTGLKYKSNGTSACGIRIDNNQGNKYGVKLRKKFFKKLSVEARMMDYANDIDHTEVLNKKIRIFAMAKAPNGCSLRTPAIVGYKTKRVQNASE